MVRQRCWASGRTRPDFKFPVYWLYLGDRDVLHITSGGKNVSENRKKYVGQESRLVTGTGVIDHLGASAPPGSRMISHLKSLNIDFKERQVATRDSISCSFCSIRTA